MKPRQPNRSSLVTELLVLRDGSVLADKLTPTMADALKRAHLHPDTSTQRSLIGNPADKTVVDGNSGGETEGAP